jgi:hypothetical protein
MILQKDFYCFSDIHHGNKNHFTFSKGMVPTAEGHFQIGLRIVVLVIKSCKKFILILEILEIFRSIWYGFGVNHTFRFSLELTP